MENIETILVLMVVIWVFGKIFRSLHLPVIFGELLGGIVVGPLVLNIVEPNSELIKILSELGIFFLMLHSGLETDPKELLQASKKSFLIALSGAAIPFIFGYAITRQMGLDLSQSLFIAMCLSCTAIIISTRLLKENKIHRTAVANITLGAAVISDILALLLFSIVLNIAQEGSINWQNTIFMLGKFIAFFGAVLFIGCKTSKYIPKFLKEKGFTLTLIVAMALGFAAEAIGLHIVLGAFLAGLFIREEIVDEKIYNKIEDRIYGLSYSFLGPIFFASLAFHLDFVAIVKAPLLLIVVIIIATIGKILGAGTMAYLLKIPKNDSIIIGIAMNSRGAVGLIIASIGLKQGIIDNNIFSILVLMAFTTTIISIFLIKPFIKHKKQQQIQNRPL